VPLDDASPPPPAVSEQADELVAKRRRSFGARACDYGAHRPSYPIAAVRWLVGEPPKDVVDLGAGTGILTVLVQELGHRVIGVEPDVLMRQEADRLLPGVVIDGSAEAIPLPDATADVVLAGQAWHWFDHERAEAEVARVLRPGGVLGLLWNLRDDEEPWVDRLGAIVGGQDRTSVADARALRTLGPSFGEVETRRVDHRHTLGAEELLRLVGTWSLVATRPDRDEALARVRALLAEEGLLDGEIALPYACVAFRAALASRSRSGSLGGGPDTR